MRYIQIPGMVLHVTLYAIPGFFISLFGLVRREKQQAVPAKLA